MKKFTTIRVEPEVLKKVKKLTDYLREMEPIGKGTIRYSDAIAYVIDEFMKEHNATIHTS